MIIITYQSLPSTVPALVHENSDDSYTIIVNQALSEVGKRKAIRHEVNHITGGDLFKNKSVNAIETECHDSDDRFLISEDLDIYIKE